MKMLCHFVQGVCVTMDFGVHQDPGATSLALRDDYIANTKCWAGK